MSKKKANGGAEAEQRHMQAENREGKSTVCPKPRCSLCISFFCTASSQTMRASCSSHIFVVVNPSSSHRSFFVSSHFGSFIFFRDVSKELEQLAIDGWERDDDDDSSEME